MSAHRVNYRSDAYYVVGANTPRHARRIVRRHKPWTLDDAQDFGTHSTVTEVPTNEAFTHPHKGDVLFA
jgi:hypothetical protein